MAGTIFPSYSPRQYLASLCRYGGSTGWRIGVAEYPLQNLQAGGVFDGYAEARFLHFYNRIRDVEEEVG